MPPPERRELPPRRSGKREITNSLRVPVVRLRAASCHEASGRTAPPGSSGGYETHARGVNEGCAARRLGVRVPSRSGSGASPARRRANPFVAAAAARPCSTRVESRGATSSGRPGENRRGSGRGSRDPPPLPVAVAPALSCVLRALSSLASHNSESWMRSARPARGWPRGAHPRARHALDDLGP